MTGWAERSDHHRHTRSLPDELTLQATWHQLHGGGVKRNLACHVQQGAQGGGLAVGPNAGGGPPAYTLYMQHLTTLCACIDMMWPFGCSDTMLYMHV